MSDKNKWVRIKVWFSGTTQEGWVPLEIWERLTEELPPGTFYGEAMRCILHRAPRGEAFFRVKEEDMVAWELLEREGRGK